MAELLDHLGNPIDMAALRQERAGATVGGVRSIWPAYHVRNMTPARLASVLRQAEVPGHGNIEYYVELAETMEEVDLFYAGILQTRKLQVSQIPIMVEPASDNAEDLADADLVTEFFTRRRLSDELRDILDAVGKGFSVTEIIWDFSERQWMPERLEYRLPRWFDFEQVGGRQLMLRNEAGGWTALADTPYKYIISTIQAKSGLPVRGGLARLACWSWLFKNYTLKDWVRFVEAYGQPLRMGKFGPSASEQDKDTLYRAVRNIAADAAAIIPDGMNIEFVDGITFQARSEVYIELLRYIDSQLSIAVLGQTLTTQPGESGSYSLGQVHNEVRKDIEQSDAERLAEVLERDLVVPIVALNHGPRKRYPRLVIERTESMDIKLLSESLEKLVPMGLRVRADEVRTLLNMTAPDDDDEVLMAPGAAAPPPGDDPPAPVDDPPEPDPEDEAIDMAMAQAFGQPDTPGLLENNLRQRLGPLTDKWVDTLKSRLTQAGSLDAFGEWLLSVPPDIDLNPVVEVLGEALAAAWLAGRYDVDGFRVDDDYLATASDRLALAAEPSADSAQLPFGDQIQFFRQKINVGTRAWTDLWQAQHDVAFVVAGATRDELLSDLRTAVTSAIEDGTTLAAFRQDFDAIVARHGWSYNGGRDWRTRVIYDTNLRTSYGAGRWEQLQAVKSRRPYWRYRHSGSENPRPHHKAWDGLVLHADDPWWRTNYPPNGWLCGCSVDALSKRDLERLGKAGPDKAPALNRHTVTVGTRGPSPRTVSVPKGVDPGFAYAPGRVAALGETVRHRLRSSLPQPPGIAARGVTEALSRPANLAALVEQWQDWRQTSGPASEIFELGALSPSVLAALAARGVSAQTATVTISRQRIQHIKDKRAEAAALTNEDVDRLPEIVARPAAVLYDLEAKSTQGDVLLYVFDPAGSNRRGKVVIELDFGSKTGSQRERITTNAVRTAGYVEPRNLRDPRYFLLDGGVEDE